MNSIFTRRSVREFTDKEVTKEQIEKILAAGMQAPSSMNQQPWEFIVVKGKNNLIKLSEFSPFSKSLANANVAIVLLGNVANMRKDNFWQQDLAACTQNILLEIAELNLGGVWYGVKGVDMFENKISDLFNLPQGIEPFCVVGLGYPKNPDGNYFKDCFKQKKIFYEKYKKN